MITKTKAEEFRNDLVEAVKALERKHGVKVEFQTFRFTSDLLDGKFQIRELNPEAPGETVFPAHELAKLRLNASLHQIPEPIEGFDKVQFALRGHIFKIVGYNTRKPKFSVALRNAQGQKFNIDLPTLKFVLSTSVMGN